MSPSFEETFEAAALRLLATGRAIERGSIFHSVGLSTGGKFFAIPVRGELLLKLPAARVAELVASETGHPFQTGGRTMREWVCVRPESEAACYRYMEEACAFVAGLMGR